MVFLVLVISTNPFWTANKYVQLLLLIALFVKARKVKKAIPIDRVIVVLFVIYAILVVVQGLRWGLSLFTFFSHFGLVYLLGYLLYQIYKKDVFILLEKVLWTYISVSLVIYFAHEFIPGVSTIMVYLIHILERFSSDVAHHSRSIMFYTYRGEELMSFGLIRNSGFAHEPGAFAVFTNLAIAINYLRGIPIFSKRNLVYFIALITTFSTAGYLSAFFLVLLVVKSKRNQSLSFLFLIILSVFSIKFFNESSFMQEKIQSQYQNQVERNLEGKTSGRFYGMRKSLYVLSLYPLHGRGLLQMTRPESNFSPEYAGYGWLAYISRIGILFGGLFLYFYIKGIRKLVKSSNMDNFAFLIFTVSLFINLTSQSFITNPYFLIFLFMGIYNADNSRLNIPQKFIQSTSIEPRNE